MPARAAPKRQARAGMFASRILSSQLSRSQSLLHREEGTGSTLYLCVKTPPLSRGLSPQFYYLTRSHGGTESCVSERAVPTLRVSVTPCENTSSGVCPHAFFSSGCCPHVLLMPDGWRHWAFRCPLFSSLSRNEGAKWAQRILCALPVPSLRQRNEVLGRLMSHAERATHAETESHCLFKVCLQGLSPQFYYLTRSHGGTESCVSERAVPTLRVSVTPCENTSSGVCPHAFFSSGCCPHVLLMPDGWRYWAFRCPSFSSFSRKEGAKRAQRILCASLSPLYG